MPGFDASAHVLIPGSAERTIRELDVRDTLAVMDRDLLDRSLPERPATSPRVGWGRLLESIVHGGMVVGMVSFLLIDLVFQANAGVMTWLTVITGIVTAVVVVVFRTRPLVGMGVVAFISLSVTAGSVVMRFVLGAVPPPVGFGEVAGVAILAAELARRAPTPQLVAGLSIGAFTTAVSGAVRSPGYVGLVAVFWLVCTVAVVMGFALRWTESSRRMTVDAARREERLAIARELHDSVAHHVTGIVVQAQAARAVGSSNFEAVEQALAGIEESGLATLSSMRRLVGALRSGEDPGPLAPTAGADEVRALIAESQERDPFDIVLDMEMDSLPPAVGPSVYRIVQESLTNVRRHGQDVTRVEVGIRLQDDGVQVTVVDDGRPRERTGESGFGLSGMAERVSALGGQFWAGARPGRGWAVTAWIPIEA